MLTQPTQVTQLPLAWGQGDQAALDQVIPLVSDEPSRWLSCSGEGVMTPERHRQIKDIFEAAMKCEPPEQYVLLVEACVDNEALPAEIESLIASYTCCNTTTEMRRP